MILIGNLIYLSRSPKQMFRESSSNRLIITWLFVVMYFGFFVGPVCNVSVSVRDGDLLLVASSTSGEADFFQEAGTDRNSLCQTPKFPVSDIFSADIHIVPVTEELTFPTPPCSFFLSGAFYLFLTSLAP